MTRAFDGRETGRSLGDRVDLMEKIDEDDGAGAAAGKPTGGTGGSGNPA